MILVALSTFLLAVGPPQAAAPAQAPAATGVIAGRLTSADQGRPVRKAQVKLTTASPRQTRTTVSDADGRFHSRSCRLVITPCWRASPAIST